MAGMSHATAADLRSARRVLIQGVTGSGKSTAAARIGRALGLPVHLADEEIGFLPASEAVWTNREPDQMRAIAAEITAEPGWVLDASYSSFRDIVLERADIVVGLDYPRWLSLSRLLRRTAGRLRDRTPVCNGNRETLRQTLGGESIIVWHFQTFADKRATMRDWAEDPTGPPTILVDGPGRLDALIAQISS
ncbi:adenylate kinase [Acidipropionibacterium jensenii]|uniref:Adenylate kinase n=2 Tax=Acidipropionibacterium jensenii TaxID=1749 RepID=A0A3Q9UKA3_9ACTN|nr:adenylate kinase [Acidipropionibacterium jensenii]